MSSSSSSVRPSSSLWGACVLEVCSTAAMFATGRLSDSAASGDVVPTVRRVFACRAHTHTH
eukprot:3555944-Prymnesium_polylepis.1